MLKNLVRLSVFALFLATVSASPKVEAAQACAAVGEGCENTCAEYCLNFGTTSEVIYAGCGCPTIGTYGNSCDCWCAGDGGMTTGQLVDGADPKCHVYDQQSEQCDVCIE